MKVSIINDKIERFTTGKGIARESRRLTVIGAGNDFSEQICFVNVPETTRQMQKGETVELKIDEVVMMFSGKPIMRGEVIE